MKHKLIIWIFALLFLASSVTAQFNGSILEQNYNLTKLMSAGNDSAIDNPTQWIANWNIEMNDIGIVTFLYVFAGLLFLIIRKLPEVKDSEALLYAGLVSTVLGIFIFAIDITTIPDYKLLKWAALLPIIVITAFAIVLNYANRNF